MPTETTTLLKSQFDAIIKANDRVIAAQKKGMADDYARMLKQLKTIVADAHEQYASEGSLSYTEMQRYNRIKSLNAKLDATTKTGTKPVFTKIKAGLETVAGDSYVSSLAAIGAIANSNIGRVLSASEIQTILNKPWSGVTLEERIGLRRTDIGTRVKQAVTQSIMQESPYEDTAKSLKEIIVKDYAHNTRLMEDLGHQVQSDSFQESFTYASEQDIQLTKTWVTAGDSKVRDDHAAMDGQTVDVDDVFTIPSGPNAGMTADGPGLFGIPEEDYGCRCWVVAGVRNKE